MPDVRNRSAVLSCTIIIDINDFEIKVTDFESVQVKRDSGELPCPTTAFTNPSPAEHGYTLPLQTE